MRTKYLKILELSPDATEKEVKEAYRRLSKKYHPDINKNPEAEETFIAISNAYDYLIHTKDSSFGVRQRFDPEIEKISRRQKARAYVHRKRREKAEHQKALMDKIFQRFNYFIYILIGLNILFATDMLLPFKEVSQEIISIEKIFNIRNQYINDAVILENYAFDLPKYTLNPLGDNGPAKVFASRIFKIPDYAIFTINGEIYQWVPEYSLYKHFNTLIPVVFILSFVYFRSDFEDTKIAISLGMILIFFAQLFLLFKY